VHIGRRIWFHWAVVACLVLGLAAAAMLLPRWGARSAKTTIIVDTAGRKIPGLFAGMPSDPRYDLALIALSPQRNFQKPHKGLMNWLLERVDTIVYAQSPSGPDPCNVVNCGICTNNYYESAGTGNCAPCTAIGTGFNKVAWRPDRADPNQGYMGSCSSSCECTAADGSTSQTYVVTVTRAKSSDDALKELTVSAGTLSPGFSPENLQYSDAVARKLEAAGIPYVRRSQLHPATTIATPCALLLDTIGELSGLFPVADVVFMGGTLAQRGGHNILEPAFFAKPVVLGPHMENFQAIADEFRQAAACVDIAAAADLAAAVGRLLDNPALSAEIGSRALARAQASRGASARAAAAIGELHRTHLPRYRPVWPWLVLGGALVHLWKWGGRRRLEAHLRAQRKLDVPVVSVGNLSMGGTGKTPCVLRLAESLKRRGHAPGHRALPYFFLPGCPLLRLVPARAQGAVELV